MQKRNLWRKQEEDLVQRWDAANERYRAVHQQLATQPADAGAVTREELQLKVQAALADIEALRRQVARLKREFISGDRY
ncbi:MAG TPA: hypothetical protein VFX67_04470 [Burkholderiales bacterium]|nr:hypothetical protein [Burkholderiales bacterium]